MKKMATFMAVMAIVAASLFGFSRLAQADEIKFVGVITKIEIAGKDANTAGFSNQTDIPLAMLGQRRLLLAPCFP